jgi:GDP-4-dehydro-6-deoxy-D-mannose reductase
MKILIIGVNGFTGINLVNKLYEKQSHVIYGCDIQDSTNLSEKLTHYYKLNILDYKDLTNIIQEVYPDVICNLAGVFKADNDHSIYLTNISGNINILEAIVRIDPINIKALFIGSAAEYGIDKDTIMPIREDNICCPTSAYGISKYASTMAIKSYSDKYNLKTAIVRPFNILGKGISKNLFVGAVIDRIINSIKKKDVGCIEVGNIESFRDFVDVEDVVNAYVNILSGDHWGDIYNICSGFPTSIKSILNIILSFSHKKIKYKINKSLFKEDDIACLYGSYEKANKTFGYSPTKSIEISLKEAWDYALNDKLK